MTSFLHHEKSKSSCLQNLIFDTFYTSSYNEKKFEESSIEREKRERNTEGEKERERNETDRERKFEDDDFKFPFWMYLF